MSTSSNQPNATCNVIIGGVPSIWHGRRGRNSPSTNVTDAIHRIRRVGLRGPRDRQAIQLIHQAMEAVLFTLGKALEALDSALDGPGDTFALDRANRTLAAINSGFTYLNTLIRDAPAPEVYTDAELAAFCEASSAINAELRAVSVALNLVLASVSRFLNRLPAV